MQVMNKYLILNFRNAKLFKTHPGTKDKKFDTISLEGQDRVEGENYKNPLTVYQISNVIHALFGERPVSSMRRTLYQRVEKYFEKALNSYILIDSPKKINKKTGQESYITEKVTLKKAVWNSWNPSVQGNWEIIRRYTEEHFDWFVDYLNQKLQTNVMDMSFVDVQKILNQMDNEELFEQLKNKELSGLIYYIKDEKKLSIITSATTKYAITIANGIDDAIILSGKIIIPVSDEDVQQLREHGKGCVTILDGGLVWIDSLKFDTELNVDDYQKVSEISTEKGMII